MDKNKVDIFVEIAYDINDPNKTTIKTNAKKERVEDLLASWVQDQIGRGDDDRVANKKDMYTINIGLDLSDDTFFTESDTGNKGLTCGIVMDVFRQLGTLSVQPL